MLEFCLLVIAVQGCPTNAVVHGVIISLVEIAIDASVLIGAMLGTGDNLLDRKWLVLYAVDCMGYLDALDCSNDVAGPAGSLGDRGCGLAAPVDVDPGWLVGQVLAHAGLRGDLHGCELLEGVGHHQLGELPQVLVAEKLPRVLGRAEIGEGVEPHGVGPVGGFVVLDDGVDVRVEGRLPEDAEFGWGFVLGGALVIGQVLLIQQFHLGVLGQLARCG